MKLLPLTSMVILLSGGFALAEPMTSGRPSAVLDEAQCKSLWDKIDKDADGLKEAQARPWIMNFQQVDTNKDGQISWEEFLFGCGKGTVNPGS